MTSLSRQVSKLLMIVMPVSNGTTIIKKSTKKRKNYSENKTARFFIVRGVFVSTVLFHVVRPSH